MYLTFHKSKNKAVCHHCSSEKKIFNKCKNEKNCDFIMYGPGVEKIYEEVSKLFPTSKIEIFSSDYMKKKDHTNSLFNRVRNNQVDILVGTQMISKGFNFPKLNCIVVIDADFSGRGYAPYLICKNCGYKQICNNCSMYLTFHKSKNKAVCHHCSSEKKLSNKCLSLIHI